MTIFQVDKALLNHLKKLDDGRNDENTLFCMSLVPKMQRMSRDEVELAQIQILQVLRSFKKPASSTATSQQVQQVSGTAIVSNSGLNVATQPVNTPQAGFQYSGQFYEGYNLQNL